MSKSVSNLFFPTDLKYTAEHIWIRPDGDVCIIGVSDYAQDQLGEVVYVDMPSPGDTFTAGDSFGEIESVKSVNKLYMPISGEIVAVNTELEDTPSLVNASCYEKGWIAKVKPDEIDSTSALLDSASYTSVL